MKRRTKVLIIIIICTIITYYMYINIKHNKINILAIGDGIASGYTSYKIKGISYNEYLKEYFDNRDLLNNYDDSYSFKNNRVKDLNYYISNNYKNNNKYNINQLIHKSDIITICIGEEYLISYNDLDRSIINEYIKEYDLLISNITKETTGKVIIISLYENKYLSKTNTIIINSELANLAYKYKITFININDLLLNNSNYINSNSIYFNYKAHKVIADMIINSI